MNEDVKRMVEGLRYCAHAMKCWQCPVDDLCNTNDEIQDLAADLIEQLNAELEQVRQERDAAVRDVRRKWRCGGCISSDECISVTHAMLFRYRERG